MSRPDRTIWCDHWYVPAYYGFCPSEAAWSRMMRKFKIDVDSNPYPKSIGACTTLENVTGDVCLVVTINAARAKEHNKRYVASVLVHEATHVWQNMCAKMGDTDPSRETEAYSVQQIIRMLFMAYEKTRGPLFR